MRDFFSQKQGIFIGLAMALTACDPKFVDAKNSKKLDSTRPPFNRDLILDDDSSINDNSASGTSTTPPTQTPSGNEESPTDETLPSGRQLIPGTGCGTLPVFSDDPNKERVIAQWDVVPYQTISPNAQGEAKLKIGVVAFFANGVDRVEVSANCGPSVVIRNMELNSETNVREYFAEFDASRMNDGAVEIRAVAYPGGVGIPKVLPPLILNANFRRSLDPAIRYVAGSGSDVSGNGTVNSPFRSIKKAVDSLEASGQANGATIYLNDGQYTLGTNPRPTTNGRWLSLVRDSRALQRPILNAAANESILTRQLKLQGLEIRTTGMTSFVGDYNMMGDYLWLDDCLLVGASSQVGDSWHANFSGVYLTRSTVRQHRDGVNGGCWRTNAQNQCVEFTYVMQRDVLVENIGSDAFSNSALVINSTARNILGGGVLHPDVYQFYGRPGDVILYGLRADTNISAAQGLFAGMNISIRDVAFVNCQIDNGGTLPPSAWVGKAFQFLGPARNMYILNSVIRGPALLGGPAQGGAFSVDDVVFENSDFINPQYSPDFPGVVYRNVRFLMP